MVITSVLHLSRDLEEEAIGVVDCEEMQRPEALGDEADNVQLYDFGTPRGRTLSACFCSANPIIVGLFW